MKKPNGTLCTTPEENAIVFRDHFNQLGHKPVFETSVLISLSDDMLTISEFCSLLENRYCLFLIIHHFAKFSLEMLEKFEI